MECNCTCSSCTSKMITGISGDVKNVCDVTFNFEDGTTKVVSMEEGKVYTVTYINNDGIVEISTGTLLGILYQENSTEYRSDVSTYNGPIHKGPIHRKVFSPPPPLPGIGALPPDHRHCWIGFPQPYCDPNDIKFHGATYYQGNNQPGFGWAGPYAQNKKAEKEPINPMHVHQEYPIVTTGSTIGFTFDCSSEGTSVAKTIMLTVIRDLEGDIFEDSTKIKTGQITIKRLISDSTRYSNEIEMKLYARPNFSYNNWSIEKKNSDDTTTSIARSSSSIYNTMDEILDTINNNLLVITRDKDDNITATNSIRILSKQYDLTASDIDEAQCTLCAVLYIDEDTDDVWYQTDNLVITGTIKTDTTTSKSSVEFSCPINTEGITSYALTKRTKTAYSTEDSTEDSSEQGDNQTDDYGTNEDELVIEDEEESPTHTIELQDITPIPLSSSSESDAIIDITEYDLSLFKKDDEGEYIAYSLNFIDNASVVYYAKGNIIIINIVLKIPVETK